MVEKLINFLKLLSDETRLRIMVLLYHQELCVCELCGVMDISQPNVSKHLAKIRDMGFVKHEKREQYVFYSLNIEDKIFKNILNDVVVNIEDYQVLKDDMEKSKYVEKYLESCKSGGGN
jgi:ArsR family transcriptional regulator